MVELEDAVEGAAVIGWPRDGGFCDMFGSLIMCGASGVIGGL